MNSKLSPWQISRFNNFNDVPFCVQILLIMLDVISRSAKDNFSREWHDDKSVSMSSVLQLNQDKSKYTNSDLPPWISNFFKVLEEQASAQPVPFHPPNPILVQLRLRYLQFFARIFSKKTIGTFLLKRLTFCHNLSSFDMSLILFDTRPHLKRSGTCKLPNTFIMTSFGKSSSFAIFLVFKTFCPVFNLKNRLLNFLFLFKNRSDWKRMTVNCGLFTFCNKVYKL